MMRVLILGLLFLSFFFSPFLLYAQTGTGVQARVLPKDPSKILEFKQIELLDLKENSVVFHVILNQDAYLKVDYGLEPLRGQVILSKDKVKEHYLLLDKLEKGTLYFYTISAYNDADAIGTQIKTFKTLGVKKLVNPNEKFVFVDLTDQKEKIFVKKNSNSNNSNNALTVMPASGAIEVVNSHSVKDFISIEDLAIILLFIPIVLLLFLLLKKMKERNEEKRKKWIDK